MNFLPEKMEKSVSVRFSSGGSLKIPSLTMGDISGGEPCYSRGSNRINLWTVVSVVLGGKEIVSVWVDIKLVFTVQFFCLLFASVFLHQEDPEHQNQFSRKRII